MKVSREEFYPLADVLLADDGQEYTSWHNQNRKYMARWTGEFRTPVAGEWFLSCGVAAYRANSDMHGSYPIADIVEVEEKVTRTYTVVRVL